MNDSKTYTTRAIGSSGFVYYKGADLDKARLAQDIAGEDAIVIDDFDGFPACMKEVELGCECHRCNGSDK